MIRFLVLLAAFSIAMLSTVQAADDSTKASDATVATPPVAAASVSESSVSSAESAEFRKAIDEWNSLQAQLAKLQLKIYVDGSKAEEIRPEFVDLLNKLDALQPKLRDEAEKVYAADDKNKQAGDLLFAMAVGYVRKDNYEDALRLAKLLIEHGYANKDINRVAASAAFALMQLDDAKKYIDAISETTTPKKPPLESMIEDLAAYKPKWEREQKFREAEAKADDLPRVKLHTTVGDIVIELFENEAPNTVANFIFLVEKNFYSGTQFHRVLPNFMAQGGDPISIDPEKHKGHEIGSGGPGYTIPCECYTPNRREHFRGTLSMAHAGRDTGGSQFFLTFVPTAMLDGKHTVFGRVIEGMDVLSKIQRIDPERAHGIKADKIISAEVVRKRDHTYDPKGIPAR